MGVGDKLKNKIAARTLTHVRFDGENPGLVFLAENEVLLGARHNVVDT